MAVVGDIGEGGAAFPAGVVGGVAPDDRRFFFAGSRVDDVCRLSIKPDDSWIS